MRLKKRKAAAPEKAVQVLARKQRRRSLAAERGIPGVIWLGMEMARERDLYARFLTLSPLAFLAVFAGAYLLINVLFALLYLADPGGIGNARLGSFADAFFFSVQTMATIGYGNMFPKSVFANLVVTVETIVGLLTFAVTTGLIFARFSRPSARVLFSDIAVIHPFEGTPALMFRMANARRNVILQAEVRVTLLRREVTAEGVEIQRQRDLKLVRQQSSFFGLTWTVIHQIDKTSPLHGTTPEALRAAETVVAVLLAGTDETLNQTVHARFAYSADKILWNHRLVDVITRAPDGRRIIDLTHFHDAHPIETSSEADPAETRARQAAD